MSPVTKKRASLKAGSGPRGGGKAGPKASLKPKAKANSKTGARRKTQAIASPQAPNRTGPEPKPVAAPSTVKLTPAPGPPPGPRRGELEDAQLVVMAQAGDTRAFDELVRRYRDRVYRLSYKILRHEEDAAESLQDAFLSAFRGLKNFKAESTFSTWLYRIATNASLMKYRKRRDNHVSLGCRIGRPSRWTSCSPPRPGRSWRTAWRGCPTSCRPCS